MKKAILIFLFISGSVVLTCAQDKSDYYKDPVTSKEVHHVGNKNSFRPSIKIASGDVSSVASKDIHKKQTVPSGSVATKGYPTWTISKGAARYQAERNN